MTGYLAVRLDDALIEQNFNPDIAERGKEQKYRANLTSLF